MHPVIVAYDGSPNAEDALSFAAWAAQLLDARLEVACAYPVGGRAAHSYDEVLRSTAMDELQKARTRVPADVKATYKPLPAISLGKALHERCEETGARLLVLGSSRHGAAHRAMAGTLAGRLLHGSPCPVAVVPAGWAQREEGPKRVVVGWDVGPEGQRALAAGEEVARRGRMPLELVKAAPTGFAAAAEWPMYSVPERNGREAVDVATEQLEEAAADVDAVVDVRTEALTGEPGRRLREHATPDDLLVLGSRGYGPVQSVLLGSVSKAVVGNSPCPVIVVPRASGQSLSDGPTVASSASAAGT